MALAALPEERPIEGPEPSNWAARGRFTLIVALCFLLHALPLLLLYYLGDAQDLGPDEQAIPVEMIAEPPPPPPQPEPPPPKNEKQAEKIPFDEKPATDAPRAANDEKVKRDATDDASHAPKPTPDTESTEKKPPSEAADSKEKPLDAKAAPEASAPKLKEDRPDAEPVNAAETQRPDAPEQTKAQQAAPQPAKQPTPAQPSMATFSPLPDYSFAPMSKNTPIAGGKAASTYLSIVYGMLASHMRFPAVPPGHPHGRGEISFDIDFAGALIRARVTKSTGIPALDAAAVAAIRAAAPFPFPPTGNGLSLRVNFSGD